jgi:hypothetical protein
MLVIDTQYKENYGAHNWDGTGECPQYWKFKGGSSYKITGVPLNIDYHAVVDMVRSDIEHSDHFSEQYILDWALESDDYLSDFEKSQQEYDGVITVKEPVIEYSDLQARFA